MADGRGRRQRVWTVIVVADVAGALVVAQAITATSSLVTGDRWDWDWFWRAVFLVVVAAVASSAGDALARRGVFGSLSPEKQREQDEDGEVAAAVRTGLLPPGADPDGWPARIRRHVKQSVVLATSGTVVCFVAAALTAAAAALNAPDEPVLWVLAGTTLLVPAPLLWLVARTRSRGERLMARL